MLCDRAVNQLGDGLLHTLVHLGFGIELSARLRIPIVGQHRLPLSCHVILEALYFIDSFLGVLSGDDAMLLYDFLVDVDVGSGGVHAGPRLCQHGVLRVDCYLRLRVEEHFVLT